MDDGVYLKYGEVTKALKDWGLSEPMLYQRSMEVCEFTVKADGVAFDGEPLFAYNGRITVSMVKDDAERVIFQGTRQLAPAFGRGDYEGFDFVFANEWKALEEITFGQQWRQWQVVDGAAVGSYVDLTELLLMTRVNPATNAVAQIHNGDQIRDVVNWAIAKGANLQLGTVTPAMYLPVDSIRDLKCSQVIQMVLKLCPDAVVEIDDSTTPPTFNCIQRASMTAVSVAMEDAKVTQLRLTRRDDLVVPAVVLKYRRTDTIDGRTRYAPPYQDTAPEGATGFERRAIFQTIELTGGRIQTVRGTIVSEAYTLLDMGAPSWWVTHGVEWLGSDELTDVLVEPALIPAEALEFILDAKESGSVAKWMRTDAGAQGASKSVTFRAFVSYNLGQSSTKRQEITLRLKTTNLGPGDYESVKSVDAAETAVAGLAQQIYDGLAVAHWDGNVALTEKECGTDIRLVNTLNVTGGTGRYAAMNAVVQEIAYDLDAGQRSLTLGWPKHLSLDDIIEVTRFNRTRLVFTNPATQGSGEGDDVDDLEMPDGAPMEDATSGAAQYTEFAVDGGAIAATVKLSAPLGSMNIASTTPGLGSILLKLSDAAGKEIKLRELAYQEKQDDGSCVEKKILVLASEVYV